MNPHQAKHQNRMILPFLRSLCLNLFVRHMHKGKQVLYFLWLSDAVIHDFQTLLSAELRDSKVSAGDRN